MPLQVRVAGETFCANCGRNFLPTTSSLNDTKPHDHHRQTCCAHPRIVNLADFLKPEEIAR